MKKITFLFIALFTISLYAQRVAPTYTWTNKSDYQYNGETEVTFKPGEVVTFNLQYTLGTTAGVADAFNFILVTIQDEPIANLPAGDPQFTNEPAPGITNQFPPAGTGGMTTASITIPAGMALSSSTTDLSYQLVNYLSFTPDGGAQQFGSEGATEGTTVFIRTQAEIDVLSVKDLNKNKIAVHFDATKQALVINNSEINEKFSIYNIMGQEILAGKLSSKEVSVENLVSGIYIFATRNGVGKFVK